MIAGARSRLSPRRFQLAWHIDHCTVDGLLGWAYHRTGIREIRIQVDGAPVGLATIGLPRPDVDLGPDTGFCFVFPPGAFASIRATVRLEFEAADGSLAVTERTFFATRISRREAAASCGPDEIELSPLPCDVVGALRRLRPEAFPPGVAWTDALVEEAVAELANIAELRLPMRPVTSYVLYLKTMASTFGFIGEHFDRLNRLSAATRKDSTSVATSPDELLSIAGHLYTLRSHGLTGNLVECGCYKGFSTCCLSHACAALGVRLDVFDSFAGLPASPDGFYAEGDFCGSIDEVEENLLTFGRREVVELHQGFFSETIPGHVGPVLCLWMDVDLASSAADVMGLLPRLPRASCVFSHECTAECFHEGRPLGERAEVLPPIMAAFAADGRPIAGRWVTGVLGALLEPGRGVPVLDLERIQVLVGTR